MESKQVKPAYKGNLFALSLVVFQLVASQFIVPIIAKRFSLGTVMILNECIFLILPLIIYFLITKENVKETLKFNKIFGNEIIIMVLIGIISQPIAMFFANISSFFSQNVVEQFVGQLNDVGYFQLIFIMAVTPAISEELTMRGIILSGYKNHNIVKASIINGLIFGMLHLTGSQFLYATFLGIMFAVIVRITNSIFSTFIIHFVFNGFNMTLNRVLSEILKNNQQIINQGNNNVINPVVVIIVQAVIALIALGIIILLIKSVKAKRERIEGKEFVMKRINGESQNSKNDKIINFPFIILVVLYIVIMFLL